MQDGYRLWRMAYWNNACIRWTSWGAGTKDGAKNDDSYEATVSRRPVAWHVPGTWN